MKRIVSIILCFFLCFSLGALTSCHGKDPMPEFVVPESFNEEEQIRLTFWAKSDTNKTQTDTYFKAIADFEALYPNIKVEMLVYTDYGRIYNDVLTNIPTRTTPNVCITYPDHIATYNSGDNMVVPLDLLISNEKYGLGGSMLKFDGPDGDEMITKFMDELKINGTQYAMPFMRSSEACYVNVDLLKKLGYDLPETLTWDFVWKVADKAAIADENGYYVNGQKTMLPFIYKSTDNMMIQMLKQKDGGYSTENAEIEIFNDTTEELLTSISQHIGNGAFTTFKNVSYPGNYFNRGQCVFAIDSTAGATWIGSNAPQVQIPREEMVDFETAVMKIPQYDTENISMISQGPSICIFNKENTNEVLASWLFAQFLLTNEVQLSYSATEGYVPVTSKAQQSQEYLDYLSRKGEDNDKHYRVKIEATELLLENVESTFITPVFNGSSALRDASGQLIESLFFRIKEGKKVNSTYLRTLFRDISALNHLDRVMGVALSDIPPGGIALLASLAIIWLGIGSYALISFFSNRKKKHKG